ncbi:MAG: hypothetical protein M1312_02795 [Patescibacteria group bacterium]|nr:hypothetical protein [Patescibacteria group bacterium]
MMSRGIVFGLVFSVIGFALAMILARFGLQQTWAETGVEEVFMAILIVVSAALIAAYWLIYALLGYRRHGIEMIGMFGVGTFLLFLVVFFPGRIPALLVGSRYVWGFFLVADCFVVGNIAYRSWKRNVGLYRIGGVLEISKALEGLGGPNWWHKQPRC